MTLANKILNFFENKQVSIPVMILAILGMFMLPLPPIAIDFLFTFNIVFSIIILLKAVSAERPLAFSAFPTLLLLATLMRLALNVASTRLVLLEGHNGPDAAGQVIQSFGQVVIGGNYVVGLIIFVILMIINFVVITKGGNRISEVIARFTLDGMPGKQMAIDADLNSGALDKDESSKRRQEVTEEASFYGAMDGASKFVRGDAIAGLMILVINLIGGYLIGVLQHDLSSSEAFSIFALLTIGDGLVAQIPSLLLATAAAIIVTRGNNSEEVSKQLRAQLLANPNVLYSAAAIMAVMGIVPGMPAVAFLSFAAVLAYGAWRQSKAMPVEDNTLELEKAEINHFLATDPALTWEDVPVIDRMSLDLGYRLVPLADQTRKDPLSSILRGTRKKMLEKFGFLFPEIIIRDNLDIPPMEYRVLLDGTQVDSGTINPDKLYAFETPDVYGKLDGELTREPAFGIEVVMIDPDMRSKALRSGYMVYDAQSVISTHLSRVLSERAHDIFSHDEVMGMLDRLKALSAPLHESLTALLKPTDLLAIFRKLLQEGVSISDIKTIATTLVEFAEKKRDPVSLTSEVRYALRRSIVTSINGTRPEITAYVISDKLDQILMGTVQQSQQSSQFNPENLNMDPNIQTQIQMGMARIAEECQMRNEPAILLVAGPFRPQIAKLARIASIKIHVLSFTEIPETYQVNVAGRLD